MRGVLVPTGRTRAQEVAAAAEVAPTFAAAVALLLVAGGAPAVAAGRTPAPAQAAGPPVEVAA
jgi:hypothetical protein